MKALQSCLAALILLLSGTGLAAGVGPRALPQWRDPGGPPAQMDVWLRRLAGTYNVEGMIEVVYYPDRCGPLPPDPDPEQQEIGPSPVPYCADIKGRADCVAIGAGPGVQCILNVTWLDMYAPSGANVPGGVSWLSPAMVLFGLNPGEAALSYLLVDHKGLPEGGPGFITGNRATFRTPCVNAPSLFLAMGADLSVGGANPAGLRQNHPHRRQARRQDPASVDGHRDQRRDVHPFRDDAAPRVASPVEVSAINRGRTMRYERLMFTALCGVLLALGAGGPMAQAAAPGPQAAAGCEPDGSLRYVCGPVNAEDLIQLGNSRWLISSGMDGPLNGGAPARGRLYLIDHEAKSSTEWFPGAAPQFRHDRAMFGDCPGPLDITSFSAHGLALQERTPGRYRLYVTGHGAREAIEVFDVDSTGARPAIAWTGCVVLPADVSANSVAILPDGGFVTTKFMNRSLPLGEAFGQVRRGDINGALYEWRPGGKVEPIAGTELSGPNGIVTSPDGRTIYVAAYGSHDIVRFERGAGGLRKQVVRLDVTPDNLRWTADGKLLTAGANYSASGPAAGWSVVEIDPQSLAARRVTGAERATGMQGATVAVRVGHEIWVGTYSGSRIGYLPAH